MPSNKHNRLKSQYAGLYEAVSKILLSYDLMVLDCGDNSDEYEPEVGTILPRLRTAQGPKDVARIVSEEFTKWFDCDAPSHDVFQQAALDIWHAWLDFRQDNDLGK